MISRRERQIPKLHLKLTPPHLYILIIILIHLLVHLLVNKGILNTHLTHPRKVIHRMVMVFKAILRLVFQDNILLLPIVHFHLLLVNFQDNMNIHYPLVPRRRVNILLLPVPPQVNILHQDNIFHQDNIHQDKFQADNIFHLQVNLPDNIHQQEITLIKESQFLKVQPTRSLALTPNLGGITHLHQLQTSLRGTWEHSSLILTFHLLNME